MHITELSEHALHLLADAAANLARKLEADTKHERRVNKRVRDAEAVFGYAQADALRDKQRAIAELRRFEANARQQMWSLRSKKADADASDPMIGKRTNARGH